MLASDSLSAAFWAFIATRTAFVAAALDRVAASDSRDSLMRSAPDNFGGLGLRYVPQPLHRSFGAATSDVRPNVALTFFVRCDVNELAAPHTGQRTVPSSSTIVDFIPSGKVALAGVSRIASASAQRGAARVRPYRGYLDRSLGNQPLSGSECLGTARRWPRLLSSGCGS